MADKRHVDLLQQGFMRPRRSRRKAAPKVSLPIVACDRCMDWHPKGRHLSREFLEARKAREATRNAAMARDE